MIKLLEKVNSEPVFTSKEYFQRDEISKGANLVKKTESVRLKAYSVLLEKNGLNLIEVLN